MSRWELSPAARVSSHGVFNVIRRDLYIGDRVRAIHTLETPDWCSVVPVTEDGRILLVRQHRFGIEGPSLEIPGGLIDPGEDPLEAARRELEEETGFVPSAVTPLGVVHANPALQGTRLHMFLASGCRRGGGPRLDELEDCVVVPVTPAELDGVLSRGEITHALVWAALLAWQRHTRDPGDPLERGQSATSERSASTSDSSTSTK